LKRLPKRPKEWSEFTKSLKDKRTERVSLEIASGVAGIVAEQPDEETPTGEKNESANATELMRPRGDKKRKAISPG